MIGPEAIAALTLALGASPVALTQSGAAETALPVMARHEGLWCGVFRRFDAQGVLVETFPTEITIAFPRGDATAYRQVNRYSPEGRPPTIIATEGAFDGDRIRFENPRIRGWATDDRSDEKGRTVLLYFEFLDGSGTNFYEAIQLSDDGRTRHRVAQYFGPDGAVQRRTLIDEVRQSPDPGQAGDPPRCEPAP